MSITEQINQFVQSCDYDILTTLAGCYLTATGLRFSVTTPQWIQDEFGLVLDYCEFTLQQTAGEPIMPYEWSSAYHTVEMVSQAARAELRRRSVGS